MPNTPTISSRAVTHVHPERVEMPTERSITDLPPFPAGHGGEMRRLIKEFNWSKTPLGPIDEWSEMLKSVVNLILSNRFPMLLWWGKEYVQLYNDAYIPVLGLKHPSPGLGRSGYTCWDEVWHVIGPLAATPYNGGPSTWMDDILLKLNRNNFVEETHFTIAYSPVPDPSAPHGIGGVLATVNEITREIITNRQMETLRKLGKAISTTLSQDEVYSQAMKVMSENAFDIPFASIHKVDPITGEAFVSTSTGIGINHPEISQVVKTREANNKWTAFAQAVRKATVVVSNITRPPNTLPKGAWDAQPHQFAYLPIKAGKSSTPVAIAIVALNPYRNFDDSYSNFVQLMADQISFGVTNAVAFEQEKKRAEALAELDRAKTAFFSNVSHEFRTPLTLMLGPLEDVLSNARENGNIAVPAENIELVHRNALRLQKLVNTLLDFSRIEAGRMNATYKATDISKLTTDLASNFRSAVEKAGLTFTITCPPIAEHVYIDHEMWEKIVLNLISNAFKFTFNGEISITLALMKDHVEFTVRDTGIGIEPDHLPRIFERFHRIPNAQSRSFEGSGIGLALVCELVKMHAGTIDVASEPGTGTTFKVRIPRGKKHLPADQVKEDAEQVETTTLHSKVFQQEALRWLPDEARKYAQTENSVEHEDGTDKPIVVLAEDNADMRDYIKSVLNESCVVHAAPNGTVALDLVLKINPDLVISDVMMPEMDGYQLVEAIRNNPISTGTPVILLSARAGDEAKVEGLQSGADDYLIKPFSRNELIARVNSNIKLSRLRKEVDNVVRYSEAQLRALVTSTSDFIYRMSADWKVMRRLDGRNFLQDTGTPISNWLEKYIHLNDHIRIQDVISKAITTKEVLKLEHQVIRADGTPGWILSHAVPILDRKGNVLEWLGTASDISTRKFYETQLEARVDDNTLELTRTNSALQNSREDLNQFTHVASHDLKEPVRKIKTFAYLLRDDNGNVFTDKSKSYVKKVLASAERMTLMLDGVLTYSALNGTRFEVTEVDLNALLKEMAGDLELITQQKGATIQFENLPILKGSRVLLYQLFYNLITNALKFTHPERSPVVTISAEDKKRKRKSWQVILVSDNGIGFDSSQNDKIFETFTRLHSKDTFEGTGLGLSLCRKIVSRHDGEISAQGRKNKGATFVIELPIQQEREHL